MGKSSIWPQIFAAVSASLVMLCTGFHYAWPSLLVSILDDEHSGVQITIQQFSWMVVFLPIGTIGGAILGLLLVDEVGRRTTLLFTAIPFIISCVLIAVAKIYWLFWLARFLAGLGAGVGLTAIPIYIGEIAESRIRGGLCVLMFVMMHIGSLILYALGPWIAITAQAIVGGILSVVFATALLWAPESPYYYAMKRNQNETRKSLAWLRGTSDVRQEVQEIQNSIALNRRGGVNFINLFSVSSNLKAFLSIIGLLTAQKLSGEMVLTFYSVDSFRSFGLEISDVLQVNMILVSTYVVTGICITFLADKVGRRPLLLMSALLCTVFQLANALYSHLTTNGFDATVITWLPIVALLGFSISYSIGLGTVPHALTGEIFPCEVKAFAIGISVIYDVLLTRGYAYLITMVAFSDYAMPIVSYIPVVCNLVSLLFIYFLVPETKRLSLNEIQASFQRRFRAQF